ncbi:MAG TPA: phage holin family protein [Casimicrobiaceae bacterium]|jgi:putative membrane protein
MRMLLHWLANALALMALPYIFTSITIDKNSFVTALIVALVLGLINTLIRPLLVLLTLPVTILTLGLFIFVINGLLFWAVGNFVPGFHVSGFWAGVFGAIVYSVISWLLSALIPKRQ